MNKPIYPNIHVEINLSGPDGNAYFILGIIIREMVKNSVPQSEIEKFKNEATSSDYKHLLQTCREYVDCNFVEED